VRQSLLGSHAAQGPSLAAAADPGIGGGVGEKMRCATLGCAAADLGLRRLLYGAVVGQRDPINGHPAAALAPTLGQPCGQESIDMACECSQGAARARQGAQHGRSRSWSQAGGTESLEAAAKPRPRRRSRLWMAPGLGRGKVSSVWTVNVYPSWLFKGY
jgi:hypothetical protein